MFRYILVLTIFSIFFNGCGDSQSAGEKFGEAVKKIRESRSVVVPSKVIVEDKNDSKKEKNSTNVTKKSAPKSLMDIAVEAKEQVKKAAEDLPQVKKVTSPKEKENTKDTEEEPKIVPKKDSANLLGIDEKELE